VPPRFFVPDASASGDVIALPDEEAEHLTRVLRLGAGDPVYVFNGRGLEFQAFVEESGKHTVRVRLGDPCESAPEPRLQVTLAQAVLKGDKMDDVVRDAVMIGAAALHPFVTQRSEIGLAALAKGRRHGRWERIAVSSAKQCGRAVVPPVREPVSFEDLLKTLLGSWLDGPALMLVEPGTPAKVMTLGDLDVEPPKAATIVVGPEGGWTAEEIEAASSVCRPIAMGQRTFRADAAGLVALSALFARWGEF
jgi:16S rRNA (uracil1498-N3)-methyltransferase